MNAFTIVPSSEHEAWLLAPRLRAVDADEVRAAGGFSPLEALLTSFYFSDEDMRWTALLDGKVVAMFGASEMTKDTGGIWLLASDDIYKHKRDFMSHCRDYLDRMHERYPCLFNYIDQRNQVTQRWLKRLGFTAGETNPRFGVAAIPFIPFYSWRSGNV